LSVAIRKTEESAKELSEHYIFFRLFLFLESRVHIIH
jgi:hypothetical protein